MQTPKPNTLTIALQKIRGPEDQAPVLKFDNPAFDELAFFYLVEGGVGKFFTHIHGRVQVDEQRSNTWIPDDEGNESYLSINIGRQPDVCAVITDRITGDF